MGYRSDVRLRMERKGYDKFKEIVQKELEDSEVDIDLSLWADSIKVEEHQVTLTWRYSKWYPEFPEIKAVNKGISYLADNDIDYHFVRIGEDWDDIEELWAINNGNIDDIQVIRDFD